MDRDIENDLLKWKQQRNPIPLLLRGARQVGKSYVIEKFGRQHFDNLCVVNFELQPELARCFEDLNPKSILQKLSLLTHHKIEPGKTLLFLDEIQECPNAVLALRYFKEQLPEQHVIGAGSLLEFTLNDENFRMPVGRVQSFYLKPFSFKEYLAAHSDPLLRELIAHTDLKHPMEDFYHQHLLEQVRIYMSLGGMPSLLNTYFTAENIAQNSTSPLYNLEQYRSQHSILLSGYRHDFGKYAKHTQIKLLQQVFEKIPSMIGDRIKYTNIDSDARSTVIKSALNLLQHSGLICPIYSTAASGIPLASLINEKKFKLLFLDIGLMVYGNRIPAEWLLEDIILLNRGAIAEQFVGQELLAYAPHYEEAHLYFWCREQKSSTAEIDFIINLGAEIFPIEVKAGATGQLKSLHLFMKEKNARLGIRISQQPLQFDGQILTIPFYMMSEISRLIKEF